jgi:signal transduction histidine kinase
MTRRVSVPITLTVFLVTVTVALTVGWQILVVRERISFTEGFSAVHWVLVCLGSVFFVLIIAVAILQAVWLVREIRTNQRQQNFIDAVTHELHTPLASLRLYLDTLRGKSLDEDRRQEFFAIMADDLETLERTIDQILRAARTAGRAHNSPVDLSALLAACVDEVRERHGLGAGDVSLGLPGRAWVRGDVEQLRVAFRNLLENAVRYGGSSVKVDVRLRSISARKLEIAVADQGLGIPPTALHGLFQRFKRLTHEGARPTRGLGLGLYIVRNVIRAHRGEVHAESDGAGRGSRFVVTLPGQLDEAAHPAG